MGLEWVCSMAGVALGIASLDHLPMIWSPLMGLFIDINSDGWVI